MLLYEIGVPFQEAKIDFNGTIPEHLRKHSITLCMIPCIVHGEVVAAPLFPAIKYLCNRYNRMDLLGRDLVSQVRYSNDSLDTVDWSDDALYETKMRRLNNYFSSREYLH